MNTLSIEAGRKKEHLVAKFNGQLLPMISQVEIISRVGELTKVQVTFIVAKMREDEVVIKEYTNDLRLTTERGHSTNDNVREGKIL